MKSFALILFSLVAVCSGYFQYEQDEADIICKKPCFKQPYVPVCATLGHQADTYYNECEMRCVHAVKNHAGACTYEDMLNNRVI